MALHLKKLCVGVSSLQDLRDYRDRFAKRHGRDAPNIHTTRHCPTRAGEILGGGSLYWVINGRIRCRQVILDLRRLEESDVGAPGCAIVMHPELVETRPRAHRPFQGWRYLEGEDAPPDLAIGEVVADDLPEDMEEELRALGLL